MGEKGKDAYETQMTKLIEPYGMQLKLTNRNGVFRRSVMNPLFNSLFVNECRNDYYYMWRLQNDGCWEMMVWIVGYSFSTLPQSFGVTLSLPIFTTKSNEEEEQELLSLYTYLINLIWKLFVLLNLNSNSFLLTIVGNSSFLCKQKQLLSRIPTS